MSKSPAIALLQHLDWAARLVEKEKGPTWRFMIPLGNDYIRTADCPASELSVEKILEIGGRDLPRADLARAIERAIQGEPPAPRGALAPTVSTDRAPRIIHPEDGPPETMALDTPIGSKIRFLNRGGYDAELAEAREKLDVDQEYEVLALRVGGWSSKVQIEAGWFNTVMFENVPDPENAPSP